MAVEIPVIVDIDSAFRDAAKQVPDAIRPLQKEISNRRLNVQINVGTEETPVIRKFKDLLNESHSSATQLTRALSNVNAEIRAIQKNGGFNLSKGLKKPERELLALRAALEMKLEAGNFIDQATEKVKRLATASRDAGNTAASAINKTNQGLGKQQGLLGSIARHLSAYVSVFAGLRLVHNIRETTAEFEMQRVALAGIIQDTTKANQLFGQIKAAAVQSPFEIKDLVSFTKQLSAYRIETDKLFDVTMRLADVSAGLGVDMSRLVLAYGQVRAASVLRGQELRQFTEAGIPLVDLLAKKFTQLRGEMVSTGEVFKLISDRAVPFSMIEEIFNDMTEAGGIFYQMQLKQSETLKGQWMKLKDVVSIAYDEMGRTAIVHDMMEGYIRLISSLIKNWERLSSVLNVAIFAFLSYKAALAGLLPFINLQRSATKRQILLDKQRQIEAIKLASTTKRLTAAEKARIANIKKMTAADYRQLYAMDKMNQSQAMMLLWRNKNNKEIVKAIQQTGLLTNAQMNAVKKMNFFQIRIKTWGSSIRTFFKSITTAISSFWPIAVISAAISSITSLISANEEQEAAIKRVEKAYHEQEQTLLTIENAYRKIQKAISDVSDEQERTAKEAASFGQKLAYAQQIVENLKKYGLGGDFDLSLLNTDNIDEFVETWLSRLNEANNLTRVWGRHVAEIANSWEASLLGLHLAGDNLSTDIKDVTSSFIKLTGDKDYQQDVLNMRNYVDKLSLSYKDVYDELTAILGEDAALAISQQRRNETEYQYQMRLLKNYERIRTFAQSDKLLLTSAAGYFKAMYDPLTSFTQQLNEIESEFDKTWGDLNGKDEILIKMAIDKVFAENQWEDWLKEAWIERINGKYNLNIQVTPTVGGVDVPKGMKSILATEFEGLFTEQELVGMNTVTEIGNAIEKKMKNAAKAIQEADKLANNFANNEAWTEKTKEKIKRAQLTINEELGKAEKDRNKEAIKEALAVIDALTKENGVYEEQIVKRQEVAKAEFEQAKAARERLLNENLSDMGKDIKQAFPGLMKDAYQSVVDENYIGRFLLSDDDLKNIKDASDAYDVWAKHMKDLANERKKMADAGVSEETVAQEQARLDAEILETRQKIAQIDEEQKDWNYDAAKAKYDSLVLDVMQATTAEEKVSAEQALSEFMRDTNFERRAGLAIEKQQLNAQLLKNNAALKAQTSIANLFKAMAEADKYWKEFGKRYNFTLRGGSGQDPWILLFKNRMKFMQDFQKGVEGMEKYLSSSEALKREQSIMRGRGLSLKIKTEDLLGTPEELKNWYTRAISEVADKIRSMGGGQFAGLGVTEILAKDLKGRKIQKYQELLQELWKGLTDFDTQQTKKRFEENLKKLAEEIKRTDTARKFYSDILELTGDDELAASMAVNVYGGIGASFKEQMQRQLDEALKSLDASQVTDSLRQAFASQDFNTILKNLDKFPEEWQKRLKEMAENNEKFMADRMKDWLKELNAAKTYGQKRVEIARKTNERIAEIEASNLSKDQKATLTAQYARKEAQDVAKLQYEVFKESPMYVDLFSDLESATTSMLRNMKTSLIGLKEQWKKLDPTEIKELQSRLDAIGGQLATRNPFKALISSLREYRDMQKSTGMTRKEADFEAVVAERNKETQMQILESKRDVYNWTLRTHDANSLEVKVAKQNLDEQQKITDEAIKQADAAAKIASDWKRLAAQISDAAKGMQEFSGHVSTAMGGFRDIADLFFSDDVMKYFDIFSDGIQKTVSGAADLASGIALIGVNPIAGAASIIKGVGSVMSGIFGSIMQANVERLNDEIEAQEMLLSRLEYQYSRLSNAMDEAFGNEYVRIYSQQLEVLSAKQAAYEKQARLERQKGKDEDKKKTEQYLQSARETADEIEELKKKTSEFFAGQDVASAAEAFADAWLSAYQEFGDTAGAIEERMEEMVKNIVQKAALSGIAQAVLGDWYSSLADVQEWDAATVAQKWQEAMALVNPMVQGMQNFATAMQSNGVSLRKTSGQFTGIARDIAGASEESITGLAAGINTQNFYISHIDQSVSAILAALTGETVTGGTGTTTPSTDPYREQILLYTSSLPQMRDDMAAIRSLLDKVIKPVGTTSTHRVII